MTRKRRSSAECLAEARRAEADARLVSLQPHKDQLLAIASEWRKLAAEARAHEASLDHGREAAVKDDA